MMLISDSFDVIFKFIYLLPKGERLTGFNSSSLSRKGIQLQCYKGLVLSRGCCSLAPPWPQAKMLKSVLNNLCAAGMLVEKEGGGREDTQFLSPVSRAPSNGYGDSEWNSFTLILTTFSCGASLCSSWGHISIFSLLHAHPQLLPFTV